MIKYVFWIFILCLPGLIRGFCLKGVGFHPRLIAFIGWNAVNAFFFYVCLEYPDQLGGLVGIGVTLVLSICAYLAPPFKKAELAQ